MGILRQQARQKMRAMGDSIPDSLQPGSMLNFGESVGRHPSSVVQAIQATHPHLERSIARSEKAEAEEKEKDDKVKAKQEEKKREKQEKLDAKLAKKEKKKSDEKKGKKDHLSTEAATKVEQKNEERKAKMRSSMKKMKKDEKAKAKEAKEEVRAFKKANKRGDEKKKRRDEERKAAIVKKAKKEARKGVEIIKMEGRKVVERSEKKAEKRLSKVQAATEKALATKQAAEKVAAKAEKKEATALKAKAKAEKAEAKALTSAADAKEAKKVTKSVDKAAMAAKAAEETSRWSRKLLKREGINIPPGSMQALAKKLSQNEEHIAKLTKEMATAFMARASAKAKLYKAGKKIPKNLQAGELVARLNKEGVPLDLILKAKVKGSKQAESKAKGTVPLPKWSDPIYSTKEAMKSGDALVSEISKVKKQERALEAKIAREKKENSKVHVNKKLAEKKMQEAKIKKQKKDAWVANNKNTARMMNKMASDAKAQDTAMRSVSMKEKVFKANHLIKLAKKKELSAKFMKKHGPKRFKRYAKWDVEKVFNEEVEVKKRLAYQSKHGRHLILRTLSAQYILRNRENNFLRAGVGVLSAIAGKMPVYPAVRTMRRIDASLQNDATQLIPKQGVTSEEKKLIPALNDQVTKQTVALDKLVKPGVVISAAKIGPLIDAFDLSVSAHQMLNNATTKVETRLAVEANLIHKIPISEEEVAAASWKANQAKMDMDRLTKQLKVLRDVLPAPVGKLRADLPHLYSAQLQGLTSLKLQLKAIRASKSPHATPLLAEQEAQLKKRIREMTRRAVTKDTKATLLQDFLHHGRMQSCLTKEVEILTTIVSLEHTMSKTMLKKNKAYLEQREQSMQREMNDLSVERANRLKEEITKMYKKKIVVLRQKESILKEVRKILQERLLRKLPKEDMLKEVARLLREKNKADQALAEEKTQLVKDEKELRKGSQDGNKGQRKSDKKSPAMLEQAKANRELRSYERERRQSAWVTAKERVVGNHTSLADAGAMAG